MSNKSKWIKAIGVAATVIGVGVNLITDWVNEQKMDEKIEEKVSEAPVSYTHLRTGGVYFKSCNRGMVL